MATMEKMTCKRCKVFWTRDPEQLSWRGWCYDCEDDEPMMFDLMLGLPYKNPMDN